MHVNVCVATPYVYVPGVIVTVFFCSVDVISGFVSVHETVVCVPYVIGETGESESVVVGGALFT